MSEQPDEAQPPDVEIEIVVDTSRATDAIHRVQAAIMFGFHPDLRESGDQPGPRGTP